MFGYVICLILNVSCVFGKISSPALPGCFLCVLATAGDSIWQVLCNYRLGGQTGLVPGPCLQCGRLRAHLDKGEASFHTEANVPPSNLDKGEPSIHTGAKFFPDTWTKVRLPFTLGQVSSLHTCLLNKACMICCVEYLSHTEHNLSISASIWVSY